MSVSNMKKFRLVKNSKNPSNDWMKKNQKKSFIIYPDNYDGNLGVPCGKINNIVVVDCDFYKGESKEFIKAFGKNFYDEFDTYTIKTGTGGYHMYFKYDEDISNIINDEHNIDIFTDNKYVVSSGSKIINNGKYVDTEQEFLYYTTYNDTDIKPMPDNLKEWILTNLTPKEKIKTKRVKKGKDTTEDKDVVFEIPKNEIRKFVDKFTVDYWSNRDQFLRWSTFCKSLNVKDIWDEVNQTKPNYDKEKNETEYWDNLKLCPMIIETILKENNLDECTSYYKF